MTDINTIVTRTQALPFRAPTFALDQLVGLARFVDAAAIFVPGCLIYFLYVFPSQSGFNSQYIVSILAAVLVALVSLDRFGAYNDDQFFGRRFGISRLIGALGFAAAILLATAFALKITDFYSRVWAVLWMASAVGMVTFGRVLFRAWTHRLGEAGRFAVRTAIVGIGRRAQDISEYFNRDCQRSVRVVGIAGDRDRGDSDTLGGLSGLIGLIRLGLVDQVVIAIPWREPTRLRDAVNALAVAPVDIRLAPEIVVPEFRGRRYVDVGGMQMLGVYDRPISGHGQILKAVEDRVLGLLFLILLAPVFAVVAAAVRLDTPGPILFRQIRHGFNNQSIEVLKFRTMFADRTDADCTVQTTRDDDRITPVGRFLRRWSLDELPQVINVLRGDMSIVGPRPHAPATKAAGKLFEDVVERYAARHKVKPGITGWAQVNGWRGETDTVEKAQKRVEYDLDYIDNWSIWLDLFIIVKTGWVLIKNENTY